jgi:pilus assembly protein CpaF
VTIRDLFRSSLRLRPDRVVIGEVRGGEALDMIQAMTSGHGGSMTTIHATTPRDALSRLETLALMAKMDLPLYALRAQVASAIDIIVQVSRLPDGSRRITQIAEVLPLENDQYRTADLFVLESDEAGGNRAAAEASKAESPRVDGQSAAACVKWTGVRPTFRHLPIMRFLADDANLCRPLFRADD